MSENADMLNLCDRLELLREKIKWTKSFSHKDAMLLWTTYTKESHGPYTILTMSYCLYLDVNNVFSQDLIM